MGPTGSGKSSVCSSPKYSKGLFWLNHWQNQFINIITGLETGVGHSLESYTSQVSNVRLHIPEIASGDLVFVDTPGFDDTYKPDVDILKMVANWLKLTYAFVC